MNSLGVIKNYCFLAILILLVRCLSAADLDPSLGNKWKDIAYLFTGPESFSVEARKKLEKLSGEDDGPMVDLAVPTLFNLLSHDSSKKVLSILRRYLRNLSVSTSRIDIFPCTSKADLNMMCEILQTTDSIREDIDTETGRRHLISRFKYPYDNSVSVVYLDRELSSEIE